MKHAMKHFRMALRFSAGCWLVLSAAPTMAAGQQMGRALFTNVWSSAASHSDALALSMPVFNGTLLALMGVSSGTYLGFMIPEKHSSLQ